MYPLNFFTPPFVEVNPYESQFQPWATIDHFTRETFYLWKTSQNGANAQWKGKFKWEDFVLFRCTVLLKHSCYIWQELATALFIVHSFLYSFRRSSFLCKKSTKWRSQKLTLHEMKVPEINNHEINVPKIDNPWIHQIWRHENLEIHLFTFNKKYFILKMGLKFLLFAFSTQSRASPLNCPQAKWEAFYNLSF